MTIQAIRFWMRRQSHSGYPEARENKALVALAVPMILSNITVPLLGLVDTAVIGHLDEVHYLGASALGGLLLTSIVWLVGFLRMATTGLSAQAYGSNSSEDMIRVLVRGVFLAWMLAALFILLKNPLIQFALSLSGASTDIVLYAGEYLHIRAWGLPASLANLVILGWLLGVHRSGYVLRLLVLVNLVNMALDVLLVVYFDLKVQGLAIATVIAEYAGMLLSIYFVRRVLGNAFSWHSLPGIGQLLLGLKPFLALNRDILIRTLSLEFCFLVLAFEGARLGDTVIATNAILLNFLMLTSFGMDGLAYAAEARAGRAKGAASPDDLWLTVRQSLMWNLFFALIYSLFFYVSGQYVVRLLTGLPEVIALADEFLPWMMLMPVVAGWSYLFDGLFIGLTRGADMRNTMLISTLLVFVPVWQLSTSLGNHGLWLAMTAFMAARGLTLGWKLNRLAIKSDQLQI